MHLGFGVGGLGVKSQSFRVSNWIGCCCWRNLPKVFKSYYRGLNNDLYIYLYIYIYR